MNKISEIFKLSKFTAKSLLNNESTVDLDNASIFTKKDKEYILRELRGEEAIRNNNDLIAQINKDEEWDKIKKHTIDIKQRKNFRIIAMAASIALLLGIGIFYSTNIDNKYKQEANILQIAPGTDKAILTIENGQQIELAKGNNYQSTYSNANGKEIVYKKSNTSKNVEYNYLNVPRGGQFLLKLSDGTKIWLNSDTKIKYPTEFAKNQDRRVELLYGEAYFDVAPAIDNNGSKFIVATKKQNIIVKGTQFGVKAYNNENTVYTTLVEGNVDIELKGVVKSLLPGQQAMLKNKSEIDIQKINTKNEVSWKNGVFVFEKKPLSEIMRTLSRWYNVEFEFKNAAKKDILFTGSLQRNKALNNLLRNIELTGEVIITIGKDKVIID